MVKPWVWYCSKAWILFAVVQHQKLNTNTWVGRVPSFARDSPSLHTLWNAYRPCTCTDTWLVQMSSAVPPLLTTLFALVCHCPFIRSHFGSETYYCVDILLLEEPVWSLSPLVLHLSKLCSVSCLGNLISEFLLATSLANRTAFWLCHIKTTS